jgi:surface protein
MKELFKDYHNFNESLEYWDVSKVEDMSSMFEGCAKFNQPLTYWNVSRVIDMSSMFEGCAMFNQPLNTNKTGKGMKCSYRLLSVTNPEMVKTMNKSTSRDQMYEDKDYWNVSNVEDMSSMFKGCVKFTGYLEHWDVSNVENMSSMFEGCAKFNGNLEYWDVSNVEDMSSMFKGCANYNEPLNTKIGRGPNVIKPRIELMMKADPMSRLMVQTMPREQVYEENGKLYWDVSKVKDMSSMFEGCTHFNQPLTNWDVSKVKDMSSMFEGCTDFNQSLTSWNMPRVKDMSNMFLKSGMDERNLSDIGYKNNVPSLQAMLNINIKKNKYGTPVKNEHKYDVEPFLGKNSSEKREKAEKIEKAEKKYNDLIEKAEKAEKKRNDLIEKADIEKAEKERNVFLEKAKKIRSNLLKKQKKERYDYNEYYFTKKRKEYDAKVASAKKRKRGKKIESATTKKIEPATTKKNKDTYFDDEGNSIPEKDANRRVTIGGKKRRNQTCKR